MLVGFLGGLLGWAEPFKSYGFGKTEEEELPFPATHPEHPSLPKEEEFDPTSLSAMFPDLLPDSGSFSSGKPVLEDFECKSETVSPVPVKKRSSLGTYSGPSQRPQKKVARRVCDADHTQNKVPSIGIDLSLASDELTAKLQEEISQHAFMRTQFFALTATALHGVAVASDPEKSRKVEIEIGRAYLQFGKGSKFYHAAHCNASAGLQDNWKVVTIGRIKDDKEITPKTRRILRCKGFTPAELDKLKINAYSMDAVAECFNRVWPKEKSKPDSLIAGTYLERVLNATTVLPRAVNLFVDKSIETALRPYMIELYSQVMHGKLSVDEACKLYCQAIKKQLDSLTEEVERRIDCMQNYEKHLEDFFKKEALPAERIKALKAMNAQHVEMRKNKFPEFKFFRMKKNKEFLAKAMRRISLDAEKFNEYYLKIQIQEGPLRSDATSHKNGLLKGRDFCKLENDGTVIPSLKDLFGHSESETAIQETLLSTCPISPEKKKPKRALIPSKVAKLD